MLIQYYTSFEDLPAKYSPLIQAAEAQSYFYSRGWFQLLLDHVYENHGECRIYTIEASDTGNPLLVLPLFYSDEDHASIGARTIAALSHYENYMPVCIMVDEPDAPLLQPLTTLFKHFKAGQDGSGSGSYDVIRIWPFESSNSGLGKVVLQALKAAGFWVQTYSNSFNRFETVENCDFEKYFSQRSSNFRYNVRRRERKLRKATGFKISVYEGEHEIEQGIEDYTRVAMRSWKQADSMYAPWTLEMIRNATKNGLARLGVLYVEDNPVATQFWTVSGNIACCARLAYDEDYKKQAVGIVLTNHMIAGLIDFDHVHEINYGYGEESYKASWMKDHRNYWGYMAFNPRTRNGVYFGVKHIAGQPIKRWVLRPLLAPLKFLRNMLKNLITHL